MKPRKLIVSRKGFDSKYGGCPSPIFADHTMYSLPIVSGDHEVPIHYRDLHHGNINMGQVVEGLTGWRHEKRNLAGLDPDVRQDAVPRYDGWRAFSDGQTLRKLIWPYWPRFPRLYPRLNARPWLILLIEVSEEVSHIVGCDQITGFRFSHRL